MLIGCEKDKRVPQDIAGMSWDTIEARAKGQTVHMMMWMGDPLINAYMNEYVRPELKNRFDINLEIASGQGSQIVNHLITEKEAGKSTSALDMVWINGETFYQLRQIDALEGPFVDKLPNSKWINWDNPFIGMDFQQPVNGMECPWGNVQLTFIYDSARVIQPPVNFAALPEWIRSHPGKFTIPLEFTGMTVLKSWMISMAEKKEEFYGPFSEETYNKYSSMLWDTLNELKPYLWKEGKSFPESLSATHQMYAAGELAFTFSNNDSEVDNKVKTGFFPKTSKAYFIEPGTIQNSHYLGLIKGGQSNLAAMVVINFLISPEAQSRKMDPEIWGDGTVLDIQRLPEKWQETFNSIPNRQRAPKRDINKALMEPDPEYMIRLYKDYRDHVTDIR